eukprot:TRINITY_DN2655_c0_g1_i7.p2 TRINITY_DN2655_c0_g1~~TRINITY_DN2655_c0_g1_i7.p2  ORF type:complete len:110 (-),score=37.46 TRINITY_DN2655_c0_g1_i7:164-493(-)
MNPKDTKGKKMVENQPKDQFSMGWQDQKTEEEKKKEEEELKNKTYIPLKKKGENFDEKVYVPLKKKEGNYGKITGGETGQSPSPIKQQEPEPAYKAKQPPGGKSNLQLF